MSKEILYHSLQAYAEQISSSESALLGRLRKETEGLRGSRMLSSVLQGRMLALLSGLLRPKKIVEIGTYTGYSALCLAEGLAEGGVVYTLDKSQEAVAIAKRYVEEAGMSKKIHFYIGDALRLLPQIEGPFDLVFIDADKRGYAQYYDGVMPYVRSGGVVIADNVFWDGRVLDVEMRGKDARTKALVDFVEKVKNDKGVEQVCLPVRDGILVVRKV